MFETLLAEYCEGVNLVLGGIEPQQVGELGDEGEVCDGVSIHVQVADLLEPQHYWEQSFDLFLRNRQTCVGDRAIIGSLT